MAARSDQHGRRQLRFAPSWFAVRFAVRTLRTRRCSSEFGLRIVPAGGSASLVAQEFVANQGTSGAQLGALLDRAGSSQTAHGQVPTILGCVCIALRVSAAQVGYVCSEVTDRNCSRMSPKSSDVLSGTRVPQPVFPKFSAA
jgi:hypothetical protein